MPTLFGFGDSYTQGHHLDTTYPNYKLWKNIRVNNILPSTWFDMLSSRINFLPVNYAIAGMSNPEIMSTIQKNSIQFKKDDIVLVNWTYQHRFRWASYERDEYGKMTIGGKPQKPTLYWKRLGVHFFDHDSHHITKITHNEIVDNRTNPLYIEEIYDFQNMLDYLAKSVGFKVYYWSMEPTLIYNLNYEEKNDKKYILSSEVPNGKDMFWVIKKNGGRDIKEETGGVINDNHLGESGHLKQFELFHSYLKQYHQFGKFL